MTVANFIGHSYKQLLDCEDLHCLLSESADELMHVQDTLMATPRAIGDFFTWCTDSNHLIFYFRFLFFPLIPLLFFIFILLLYVPNVFLLLYIGIIM